MTTDIEAFRRSLSNPAPADGSDLAVQALWWAGTGDWERAHGCVQQHEGDPGCDWVHAYLHRLEGDAGNARYWYRRAGQAECVLAHGDEWSAIATALLARGQERDGALPIAR